MKKVFLIITSIFSFIAYFNFTLAAQSNGDLFMHPYLYAESDDMDIEEDFNINDRINPIEESNHSNIKHVRCEKSILNTHKSKTPSYLTVGHYDTGDLMFVWAKSGYNLREEPHTNSSILSLVGFGEGLTVIERTHRNYVDKAVSYVDHSFSDDIATPYIINGHWVKVRTDSGLEGYVIDQYLLSIEPKNKSNPIEYYLNIPMVEKDVKILRELMINGDTLFTEIGYKYDHRIKSTLAHTSTGAKTTYKLLNFTIKEAFILFSSSWGNMDEYDILENKENLLIISDRNNCNIKFKNVADTVLVTFDCKKLEVKK